MYRAYFYAKFERYQYNILLRNLLHKFVLVFIFCTYNIQNAPVFSIQSDPKILRQKRWVFLVSFRVVLANFVWIIFRKKLCLGIGWVQVKVGPTIHRAPNREILSLRDPTEVRQTCGDHPLGAKLCCNICTSQKNRNSQPRGPMVL